LEKRTTLVGGEHWLAVLAGDVWMVRRQNPAESAPTDANWKWNLWCGPVVAISRFLDCKNGFAVHAVGPDMYECYSIRNRAVPGRSLMPAFSLKRLASWFGHERVIAISSLFVSVCALAVTFFQVQTIKDNAQRQMRAYVYANLVAFEYPALNPDRLGIGIVLNNSGLTWARKLAVRKATIPFDPTAGNYDPWTRAKWSADEPPMVIGPRQELKVQLTEIWLNEMPSIIEGKKSYDFAVWVTYYDTLTNVRHETRLVQRFAADKDGGYAFGYGGPNNCVDDDCTMAK
jgi:hypothetical protein